ncbi:hypothetical protein ACROYT_G015170 [Oculina patagonica]
MENVALSTLPLKPEEPEDSEEWISYLPWLDFKHCSCNCSHHPQVGKVLVNHENKDSNIYDSVITEESSESESEDSAEEINELPESQEPTKNVLYAERFKLTGCTFHKDFQSALKKVSKKTREHQQPACVSTSAAASDITSGSNNSLFVPHATGISVFQLPTENTPGEERMGNALIDDFQEFVTLESRDCVDDAVAKSVVKLEQLRKTQYQDYVKTVIKDKTIAISSPIKKNKLPL